MSPYPQVGVAKLAAHFKNAEFGRPARPEVLAELRSLVPQLPADLEEFWSVCDGIDLKLDFGDRDGRICSSGDCLARMKIASWLSSGPSSIHHLLPVRDDGCGDYDCVVGADDALAGSVVFLDQYSVISYLPAGSFRSFFEFWVDQIIFGYLPNGDLKLEHDEESDDFKVYLGDAHPWPFDTQWVRRHDPRLDELLRNPDVTRVVDDLGAEN